MAIAVEQIKEGKDGAVIINCSNTNSKEKLKEMVVNELGNKYSVVDGRKKDPRIIIRGAEEEYITARDEDILEALKEQNDLEVNEHSTLSVHSKYNQKGQRNKGNIILTVDVTLKNKICELGKLNIGWRRCVVHEYFSITRCYKCARYGHIAIKCENNLTCINCAGPHRISDCESNTQKCINCEETNRKVKKALKTDHSASDPNCPCYRRIVEIESKKTKNE